MAQVLISFGGWEGHFPSETSELISGLLRERGHWVTTSDTLEAWLDPGLSDFDLIVPIWTMGEITPEQFLGLQNAVLSGTGLAGFHGGMGDAFRSHSHYQYMVGGQFVAHPGDRKRYTVNVTQPSDPIMAGLSDFEVNTEQYYMHVDPSNEVLATTTFDGNPDEWTRGTVMPVAWKRQFGAGRVFYLSIGHDLEDLEHPTVREILVRGMDWAAR